MRNSKTHYGRLALFLLFFSAFCLGAYKLTEQALTDRREKAAFEALSAVVAANTAADGAGAAAVEVPGTEKPVETPRVILPQYAPLYEKNKDLFGWLRIEGTVIDYPVMYTPDRPEYYLHRDFDGANSVSGVLFVDERCPADGNYYLIYGHHMGNGSIFGKLYRYENPEYRDAHAIIHFDTLYEEREYTVIAAFYSQAASLVGPDIFRYYDYPDLTDERAFAAFWQGLRAVSLYDVGIGAAYGDELIALSTCSYQVNDGRFVVVAKRTA